jgi:hypothetical protein
VIIGPIAALAGVVLLAAPASATEGVARGTLQDGEHNYQIAVAAGWRPTDAPAGTLLSYQGPGKKGHLAITRVEIGRVGKEDQPRMVDEIERGVEKSTRGYKRLKRKLTTTAIGVPVLDLVYQRGAQAGGHPLIMSRFLLFRRHTVVLSIGVDPDERSARRDAEAMIQSFTPFVP